MKIRVAVTTVALALLACEDPALGPVILSNSEGHDLSITVPNLRNNSAGAASDVPLATASRPHTLNTMSEPPSEFDQPPSITSYYVRTSFDADGVQAWAYMKAFGNRGRQKIDLALRYNGQPVASASPETSYSEWYPWNFALDTQGQFYITSECGHVIDANSSHAAWHEWAGFQWGRVDKNDYDGESQVPCDDERGGGGGDGGGSGGDDTQWYICYYTHYYDEQGTYLYSVFHGCEPLN